jgi:Protein of unknown function (DUF2283)
MSREYRPICLQCRQNMTIDTPDPCLGELSGVWSACCGHGYQTPFVSFQSQLHESLQGNDALNYFTKLGVGPTRPGGSAMRYTFNADHELLYVYLHELPIDHQTQLADRSIADLTANGELVGLEVLNLTDWQPDLTATQFGLDDTDLLFLHTLRTTCSQWQRIRLHNQTA